MASITIGQLTVAADEGSVQLALGEEHLALQPREATELQRFLREHAPRERRLGFRVPLAGVASEFRDSLKARVAAPGRMLPAQVVDLSLTGILLELEDPATLPPSLALDLELGNVHCLLDAELVRYDGQLLALHFPASLRNGELDPPESLRTIFGKLEQAWLQSRLPGDKTS